MHFKRMDSLTVPVNRFQCVNVEFRLAGMILQRIVHRRHGRLARAVGKSSCCHAVERKSAAFVTVQVNGQIDSIL